MKNFLYVENWQGASARAVFKRNSKIFRQLKMHILTRKESSTLSDDSDTGNNLSFEESQHKARAVEVENDINKYFMESCICQQYGHPSSNTLYRHFKPSDEPASAASTPRGNTKKQGSPVRSDSAKKFPPPTTRTGPAGRVAGLR